MIHHTVWVRVMTKTDLLAQQWGKVNRPMHAARFGWIEYGISMDSRSAKQVLHAGITTKNPLHRSLTVIFYIISVCWPRRGLCADDTAYMELQHRQYVFVFEGR